MWEIFRNAIQKSKLGQNDVKIFQKAKKYRNFPQKFWKKLKIWEILGLDSNSATLAMKKVAEKIKISRPSQCPIRPHWPNSATVGNTGQIWTMFTQGL